MTAGPLIAEVVEQHCDNAATLWLTRTSAVGTLAFRLADFDRFDERIEANIDGLRVAEVSGWTASLDRLDDGGAGEFFVAGVLALESDNRGRFDLVTEQAYLRVRATAGEPYHQAYDPWRGLISALAWVERAHAASAIERLLNAPRPGMRRLGVAACGARRTVRQPGLEIALTDSEPSVRARAARAVGELGRADLRGGVNELLSDPDEDCRFWAAWSAARFGVTDGVRALELLARAPGPRCDHALDLLLRCLPIARANEFLRALARDAGRRRAVVRATGVIGDPLYIPWLVCQTDDPAIARAAGDAIATISGVDVSALDRVMPPEFQSELNDDPDDANVALDEDGGLAWPDRQKVGQWWESNKARFSAGTPYFRGTPKASTDWIGTLSEAPQRQRRAAAVELALRRPGEAMFEVRARAALQRRLLNRAGVAS